MGPHVRRARPSVGMGVDGVRTSFSASGDEGWQTSFVSRSGSWEARQLPTRHTTVVPAGCRGCMATYWGQSVPCADLSVKSTLHDLATRPRKELKRLVPEREREIARAGSQGRPAGSRPAQHRRLPLSRPVATPPVSPKDVRQDARTPLGRRAGREAAAPVGSRHIAPVRNEIAHVREIDQDRLLRASVACSDVMGMLQKRTSS